MKTQSVDTSPEIESVLIEAIRKMSVAERFQKIEELNRFADMLAEADVRERYPGADEREVRLRVASRRLPAELMRKAFGWDPEEKGY